MCRFLGFFTLNFLIFSFSAPLLAGGWGGWLGPERNSIWREGGIEAELPSKGPPVLWRTPIGGGYTGPAVEGGRVYLMDRQLAEGIRNPSDPFDRSVIRGNERVLCLNEADGKLLWKYEYDCPYSMSYPVGPRATPVVSGGKVYTLGAEGNLCCLDTSNGKLLWSRDFKKDFGVKTPLWGWAAHPLLEGNKLICVVGGSNSVAVAFDKDTGKELWRALSAKEPGYCPPVSVEAGGKRQLIIWHPESVNSLNPETGAVYWSVPFQSRNGLTIATPRQLGDLLFFTTFYNGSLMLRLDSAKPGATVLWRTEKASEKDTTHLNAIMCTPFLEDGHIYGVCSYGQLRCLSASDGKRIWETFKATTSGEEVRWANAFIVKNGDRFFLFNEKGDLIIAKLSPSGYEEISRAHLLEPTSTASGRDVLWSHPAFASRHMYARNDKEIICVDLAKK